MSTITKLFSNGLLQSAVELNEITYNSVKISPTGIYSAGFDELGENLTPITTVSANNYNSDGNTGYFFRTYGPLHPSEGYDRIQAGWTCVQIPGSVVVSVVPDPDDNNESCTITITGGTFILNTFYSFNNNVLVAVKERKTSTGKYIISGSFDEVSLNNLNSVVTSGLALYLDAGSTSSYSGSGSTWNDISGNGRNTTLYNNPTFTNSGSSSYFTFNGSNQYGLTGYTQPIYNTTSTNNSWNVWLQTAGGTQDILVGSRKATGNIDEWNKIRSDGQYEWAHPGAQYFYPTSISLTSNTWYNLCYIVNSGSILYYLNGSLVGSSLTVTSNATVTQPFYVGGDPNANGGNGEWGSGKIAVIQVYDNTALNSTQVMQNFNELRS